MHKHVDCRDSETRSAVVRADIKLGDPQDNIHTSSLYPRQLIHAVTRGVPQLIYTSAKEFKPKNKRSLRLKEFETRKVRASATPPGHHATEQVPNPESLDAY